MSGRDNGFVAHHYVPLADLDPRLADAMLEVLRSEAIAAYVEPSTGIMGGYLEMHMPDRPHDRLWVDRDRHDRAAALLSEQTAPPASAGPSSSAPAAPPAPPDASPPAAPPTSAPIPPEDAATPPQDTTAPIVAVPPADTPTLDAAWAELMASYDQPADDVVPRWPASENLVDPTPGGRPDTDAEPSPPVRRRIVRPADTRPDEAGFGRDPSRAELEERGPAAVAEPPGTYRGEYDPLSVLDEHFVPPSPPPPPALRPATKWAILAIVVGFGLIVARTFTDTVPQAILLGVLGIVGGFATLVAGMRPDRDDDSDPDDGAVV